MRLTPGGGDGGGGSIATPARVAHRVMTHCRHNVLAGAGALAFATAQVFTELDFSGAVGRAAYAEYTLKQQQQPEDRPPAMPGHDTLGMLGAGLPRQGASRPTASNTGPHARLFVCLFGLFVCLFGLFVCLWPPALDAHGSVAAAVSTSGMAFKAAGRVGDSALPGAARGRGAGRTRPPGRPVHTCEP